MALIIYFTFSRHARAPADITISSGMGNNVSRMKNGNTTQSSEMLTLFKKKVVKSGHTLSRQPSVCVCAYTFSLNLEFVSSIMHRHNE